MSVQVVLGNCGQSPALKVKWRAEVHLMRKGKRGMRSGGTDPTYKDFAYDVPAQGERETLFTGCGKFGLGKIEVGAFQDDIPVNAFVKAIAEGKDVFGNKISVSENFLTSLYSVPENLDEIDVPLGTHSEKDEGDEA